MAGNATTRSIGHTTRLTRLGVAPDVRSETIMATQASPKPIESVIRNALATLTDVLGEKRAATASASVLIRRYRQPYRLIATIAMYARYRTLHSGLST